MKQIGNAAGGQPKRTSQSPKPNKLESAASLMGKASATARKKRWGAEEFQRRMREWGKLGGRPKKSKNKKEK